MKNALELLKKTRVEVAPETYFLVSLRREDWQRLLENPELAPRVEANYMILQDAHEISLLVDETDWQRMRFAIREAKFEGDFRLVTLNIELGWNVIGYLALVTKILAETEIPVGAISAFSRDHLLIKQADLPKVFLALREYVAEIC
jgi:hypothetical protein